MAIVDDVKKGLEEAGKALKADLWKPEDNAFLAARAKDLVGLATKAASTTDARKKAAYLAAAKDTIHHVKLVALIRMEVGLIHVLDALGRFFLEKAVPVLISKLPSLAALDAAPAASTDRLALGRSTASANARANRANVRKRSTSPA